MVTDSPDSVIKSKTSTGNTISDHEVVYLLTNIRIPRSTPQLQRVRNLRAIVPVRLLPFYSAADTSVKADLLGGILTDLLQQHAPERTVVVCVKRTPWITEAIKQAVVLRDSGRTTSGSGIEPTPSSLMPRNVTPSSTSATTCLPRSSGVT